MRLPQNEYIYVTIRLLAVVYLLYRLWVILFRYRLFGMWDRIFTKQEDVSKTAKLSAPDTMSDEMILGKTQAVYLEDPEVAATVPVRSEELPPSDYIGKEEDISSEDVEAVLSPGEVRNILSDDELYDSENEGVKIDPDFSSALTFDQLQNAVNVLSTSTNDQTKVIDAAQTLYTLRTTDMFEFFTAQVSNTERVEQLFKDCLDGDGMPLPQRKIRTNAPTVKFDWGKFI